MSEFMLKVGLHNKINTNESLFVKCVRIIYMINIPDECKPKILFMLHIFTINYLAFVNIIMQRK